MGAGGILFDRGCVWAGEEGTNPLPLPSSYKAGIFPFPSLPYLVGMVPDRRAGCGGMLAVRCRQQGMLIWSLWPLLVASIVLLSGLPSSKGIKYL